MQPLAPLQSVLMVDVPLRALLEWLSYQWSPYQERSALAFEGGYLTLTRLTSPKITSVAQRRLDRGEPLDKAVPTTLPGHAELAQGVVEQGWPLELQGDYRRSGHETTSVTVLTLYLLRAGDSCTELQIVCPHPALVDVLAGLRTAIAARWQTRDVESGPTVESSEAPRKIARELAPTGRKNLSSFSLSTLCEKYRDLIWHYLAEGERLPNQENFADSLHVGKRTLQRYIKDDLKTTWDHDFRPLRAKVDAD